MTHTIVACFMFLIFAGAGFAAETPRRGGRLVVGLRNDITAVNPFMRTTSTNFAVRGIVYEPLIDFDKDGKIVPALATSWKVSPDGKNYTFNLRRGVKFHNGKEMTAADVKWSVAYAMDPKNAATGVVPLRSVGSVSAKDKYTVEFVMKEVDSAFLATLGSIRPFPVVPEGSITEPRVQSMPPGTGPFAFKEYKPDREIVFVRHPDYWQKGLPYLDELVLRPIRDETVRFTSVRAGDVDMIERTAYGSVRGVLKGEYPDLRALPAKYAGFRRLLFNVVDPPFNNLKVRQAVRYALDKKQFIEGAFWGLGEPADQLVPKESPWFMKLPEVKRDVEKVKALLKEAGVAPNLEVELMGLQTEGEELQVIQSLLSSAGIKTKVTILERGARETREDRGDYMMIISGSDVPTELGMEYPGELSCNEEGVKAKKRGENAAGYCNKEVDRLMAEAAKTIDPKKRYEVWAKVVRIIHEELPEIPLAFVPRYYTFHKKVRGFETDWDGRFNMTTAGFSRVWIAP
jgi:ABC-type transport system substrate-binding protein